MSSLPGVLNGCLKACVGSREEREWATWDRAALLGSSSLCWLKEAV